MARRKRVYVAGPVVLGDLRANIRRACDAGLGLLAAGLAPFVPHLSCYMGQVMYEVPPGAWVGPEPEVLPRGLPVEHWYECDMEWVRVSDALLRLPGEGKGSDAEVAEARRLGIPVFFSVADVIAWAKG